MSQAPRIDRTRKQINATIALLAKVLADLETLNSLAYDRSTAKQEIQVKGGMKDYALDTHGDPVAREALRQLSVKVEQGRSMIESGAISALLAIRDTEYITNVTTQMRIPAEELLEQLIAQARRIDRGEYMPGKQYSQPVVAGLEKAIKERILRLEKENRKLKQQLTRKP